MDLLSLVSLILVGGVLGVFAGAVIDMVAVRLPADLDPLGAPVCVGCTASLATAAFLPFHRTACARCGRTAGWHKPATELAAAVLTVLALVLHGPSFAGISVALFSLLLLLILRIDWQHHLIYTITILPGLILAFGLAALRSPAALISSFVAAIGGGLVFALFFALAVLIYRRRALGFGDILLAVLIGAMTGIEQVVPALFLGMVLGAVGGIFLVLIGKRTRTDYIPYGAYLCAGTIIVLLIP